MEKVLHQPQGGNEMPRFGGRGTILGTALGLILVQVLENGLSLAGVKGDGTIVLIGVVLIATLLVSTLTERRARA